MTAGPVLIVWLIVSGIEFLIAEWFAGSISYLRLGPWWDAPGDLHGWALAPLVAMILPLFAAYRTALFEPARRAFRRDSQSIGEVAWTAFERVVPVFSTRMTITSLQIGALLFCSWMLVRMPLFVVLPLGLTLVPALYLAATRREPSGRALMGALEVSRKHWLLIYGAHGIGLGIVMLSTAGGVAVAVPGAESAAALGLVGKAKILVAYLAGRYLDWVIVTGTYLFLDERDEL